jgi:hypothetical protein
MNKVKKYLDFENIIESCGGGHSGCGSRGYDLTPSDPGPSSEDIKKIRAAITRRKSSRKNCPECGSVLITNAKFCHGCGHRII